MTSEAEFRRIVRESRNRLPLIKGLPYKVRLEGGHVWGMRFWCPFCTSWHHHSPTAEGFEKYRWSHRVAHCGRSFNKDYSRRPDSPFSEEGYFIDMMTRTELKRLVREITAYLKATEGLRP